MTPSCFRYKRFNKKGMLLIHWNQYHYVIKVMLCYNKLKLMGNVVNMVFFLLIDVC